jgi:hypothetical protein
MRRAMMVALGTGAVITSAAALSTGAAGETDSATLSAQQHAAQVRAIEARSSASLVRCEALAEAERELCRARVEADRAVRLADADVALRHTQQASRAAQRARIDARYRVARAECNTLGGFKRDKCLVQVHAMRGRAMLAAAAPYEARF